MASPAAVLNIAVQASGIAATQRDLNALDKSGGRAGGTLAKFGKVMALGVAGGVAAAGAAVKSFVDAAAESEKSSAALKTQLKALGIDYGKHADQIDKVIAKHSALSGLDDEDLQDSFTNIVRVTGDVNKALELNALAADLARAKGIDVAKAGELVGKVAGGNIGVLSRYGIQIEKGATASEALAQMQGLFAGQAEAYGNTAAGAQEKFGVAVENLQEVLGERLLPIVTKVVGGIADFVNGMQTGEGAGGRFAEVVRSAFEKAKEYVRVAVTAIKGWLESHRDDLDAARQAAENVGKAIQWAFENVALPIIQRVLPVIKEIVTSTFEQIGGLIDIVVGLINGDWARAWEGLQAVVKGALDKAVAVVGLALDAFKAAGGLLLDAIVEGFKALPGAIVALAGWLKDRWVDALELQMQALKALGKWVLERWIDGLKATGSAVIAVAGWLKDRLMDGLEGLVDGFKTIGKWVLDKIVDGLKLQGAIVIALAGWIKNRVMDGLEASLDAIQGLGRWVLDKVVDGLKARAAVVEAVGGWLKNRIDDGLTAAVDAIKGLGGWILDKILDGFKDVGSKVREAVKAIKDAIVDAVKSVFADAISIPLKVKIPDIDLNPFGGSGGGNVGPGGGNFSNVQGIANASLGWGLSGGRGAGQGYRAGDDGWHGQNRARDLSGSPGAMLGFARMLANHPVAGRLLELIYTPLGFGIKNGRRVPNSFWGAGVLSDHYDHVHVAMANGALVSKATPAIVGEGRYPEAVLPLSPSVFRGLGEGIAGAGGGGFHGDVKVFIDGQEFKGMIRTEIGEHGRQQRNAYWAGK